jgi:hypothetical protein
MKRRNFLDPDVERLREAYVAFQHMTCEDARRSGLMWLIERLAADRPGEGR